MINFPIPRDPPGNFLPLDDEITDEGHWWILDDAVNPFLHYNWPVGGLQFQWLQQTTMKLYLAGYPVFDTPGDFPTFSDANGWLGSMRAVYKHIPPDYRGYRNTSDFGVFDLDNLDGILQFTDENKPNNPHFPFGRVYSGSVIEWDRDFPSPWDFTTVWYSMVQRVYTRTKRFLQVDKLARFGKHGGRPRKP